MYKKLIPFFVLGLCLIQQTAAQELNLSTGELSLSSNQRIRLQNIQVDQTFYNAEIELQLDGTYQIIQATPSNLASSARYSIIFSSNWSAETHPYEYPEGLSHFSGLIGATHRNNIRLWQTGQLASPGIESMAETGSKTQLINEINEIISFEQADQVLSGGGIGSSPGSVSLEFEVQQAFPFISLVSMIAPSPDWFVGISNLSLIQNGNWIDELSLPLFAYDSGTDDGLSYTSGNADSNPAHSITRINEKPFLVDGEIRPLGSFTLRRISN